MAQGRKEKPIKSFGLSDFALKIPTNLTKYPKKRFLRERGLRSRRVFGAKWDASGCLALPGGARENAIQQVDCKRVFYL